MSKETTALSSGWRWRLSNARGNATAGGLSSLKDWNPVAAFPSVIHKELLEKKLIPNPDIGENERLVQWVGEVDWEYSCSFPTPSSTTERKHADLIFDGLDTFATVRLNGTEILKSDNMFIPARVPVKDALKPAGETNDLVITFDSALRVATELEKKDGARTSMMRDKRRMHIRKAQYHWGWDWGPMILTAGPYLPVRLETYTSRLDNVYIVPKVSEDHSSATVAFTLALSGDIGGASKAEISILDSSGAVKGSSSIQLDSSAKEATSSIQLISPKLWWPNGQGDPHLHTAVVRLLGANSEKVLDESSTKFGVRNIELVQRPLDKAPGTTFMFRVNGRDIFAQGGNWIPADMLLPTISRERYFEWVSLAQYSHLNMIRVWGGGIYEPDDFFDACDEMGILVWLDCAFACGDYPIHDGFMNSIAKEVEAQAIRLRNRASLALLCGGNEDFMLTDMAGIDYDHADLTGPFDDKPFPQRKIYLEVLPKVAARVCPNVPYWANSPFGGATANDLTVGDVHQWSVWHGEQLPYQKYKEIGGRFVSEFGMHAFPVYRTIAYFCRDAPAAQWHPQSRLIDCHNKGHGAHTRIARYLAENFRFDMTSLSNFAYSSHLLQSEAFSYAIQHWKRLFRGPGREECAGAVLWQLNDVYPVTSWAFVDYFLRPKPAFYAIRRAFAPLAVGAERTPETRWVDEDKPRASEVPTFALWAHNTAPVPVEGVLRLRAYDSAAGAWTELAAGDAERKVSLAAGQTTELDGLGAQTVWTDESLVILEVVLSSGETGEELARYVDWPEPYRYLYWPEDTKLSIRTEKWASGGSSTEKGAAWEDKVTVSANQPLKGVWLEPVYDGQEKDDDREPLWDDNMIDLMPGQEIAIGVKGLRGRKVSARFLADWEIPASKELPTR